MNREVMGRQMFAQGGPAYPMQDGGTAPMAAPQGLGPTMPGLPQANMDNVDIDEVTQAAIQQGIDPEALQGMLGSYSKQVEELNNTY